MKSALDCLAKQSDVGALSKAAMTESLRRRFDIDNIQVVDVGKYLVETRGRTKVIRLNYPVVIPLMLDDPALLEFEHAREVRPLNRPPAELYRRLQGFNLW